ncbi:MAG TPA: GIY-YIG nuclease family protein [Candidatus Saccharimonadales bacterium]|nr:GIY-YIG nuclease family protein [Candidatus Saccharimonadales bacterium]
MKEEMKHFWLYVLRLEQGKYYIGITSRKNPEQRIEEHMRGFYSAQWVKRYKPIEPLEIISLGLLTTSEAEQLELKRTLQYMKKYGYQNVRGAKLNYSGRYIKIGYRFWQAEDMFIIFTILLLMAAVVSLILKFY